MWLELQTGVNAPGTPTRTTCSSTAGLCSFNRLETVVDLKPRQNPARGPSKTSATHSVCDDAHLFALDNITNCGLDLVAILSQGVQLDLGWQLHPDT